MVHRPEYLNHCTPVRILTLYAHPDDESFGPAALLAKYARQGAVIHGVFATRGEHGQPLDGAEVGPEEMGRLREQDLREAATAIGYAGIELLDYEDGTLEKVAPRELEQHALAAIRLHRPDVVLAFGPAGITRHPDHLAMHVATVGAFHRARQEGLPLRALFYDCVPPERAAEMQLTDDPDGNPNTFVDVAETAAVKLKALELHARHVKDAEGMLRELQSAPPEALRFCPVYRAWPEVPRGKRLAELLEGV